LKQVKLVERFALSYIKLKMVFLVRNPFSRKQQNNKLYLDSFLAPVKFQLMPEDSSYPVTETLLSRHTARLREPDNRIDQRNNFNLLRLIFALMVVLQHCGNLSGARYYEHIPYALSGAVAVPAFFVVSGYLIFLSYERSKSLRDYFIRRARRLYPAYFTAVVLAAVMCFFFSDLTVWNYFGSKSIYTYLAANLTFLNFASPELPGVFGSHPHREVNGALWTIKIEVMFYASVPILVWFIRRWSPLLCLGALYVFSMAWNYYFLSVNIHPVIAKQLPGQLIYFCAGGILLYYREWFEARKVWLGCVAGLGFLAYWLGYGGSFVWPIYPIMLALLVVGLACWIPPVKSLRGDCSYGVYVFHFPIIQMLVASELFGDSPLFLLAVAMTLSVVAGLLSWYQIEKRFLGYRHLPQ
jgi:peptidoglycan/LPS O-acetylase OafA/YrhL